MMALEPAGHEHRLLGSILSDRADLRVQKDNIVLHELDRSIPRFTGEFWTSKQRDTSSIHEISYRACFKPQLPSYFIKRLSEIGDTVFDPFSGRGTTILESALDGRNVISNDVNPLSRIIIEPRLDPPGIEEVEDRMHSIDLFDDNEAEIDLSMFYHPMTLSHLVSLRAYLQEKKRKGRADRIDRWIAMVATSRLSGHSPGFFSVYTLPPNQAVSPERQIKINKRLSQKPEKKDIKDLILRKTRSLLRNMTEEQLENLRRISSGAVFTECRASSIPQIKDGSVDLTITSPPFLNVVQYSKDNWLRCWFNGMDAADIERDITVTSNIDEWEREMQEAFNELYRITNEGGWIAFEVGEVRKGSLKLEENVVPIGETAGFECISVMINQQTFTKTSNIWGVNNNRGGTNSNRISVFRK